MSDLLLPTASELPAVYATQRLDLELRCANATVQPDAREVSRVLENARRCEEVCPPKSIWDLAFILRWEGYTLPGYGHDVLFKDTPPDTQFVPTAILGCRAVDGSLDMSGEVTKAEIAERYGDNVVEVGVGSLLFPKFGFRLMQSLIERYVNPEERSADEDLVGLIGQYFWSIRSLANQPFRVVHEGHQK